MIATRAAECVEDVLEICPGASGVSVLSGGVENHTFLVQYGASKRVLCVLRKRDHRQAEAYRSFLGSLEEAGYPVPRPELLEDGSKLGTIRGCPAMLTTFIEGRRPEQLTERELSTLGDLVGRLHSSGIRCDSLPFIRMESKHLDHLPQDDPAFLSWLRSCLPSIDKLLTERCVPIHGDLFVDNLLVSPIGELWILDWEDCATDYGLLDIGAALIGLTEPGHAANIGVFISRYQSWTGHIDQERLWHATLYAGAFIAYRRYLRWLESKDHARSYIGVPELLARLRDNWVSVLG